MNKNLDEQEVIEGAVEAAAIKQEEEKESEVYTTKSGIRLRFRPVGTYSIGESYLEIPSPEPPMMYHPSHPNDEDKMYANHSDPTYIAELKNTNIMRQKAQNDAMLMLGIEFLDEIPEKNNEWIEKLIALNKIPPKENPSKHLKRLWYIKYMTVDYMDILKRVQNSFQGVSEEGVAQSRAAFKSSKAGVSDRGSEDKEQS